MTFGIGQITAVKLVECEASWGGSRPAAAQDFRLAIEAGVVDATGGPFLDAHGPLGLITSASLGLPPAVQDEGAGNQGSIACAAQGCIRSAHVGQLRHGSGPGEDVIASCDPGPAPDLPDASFRERSGAARMSVLGEGTRVGLATSSARLAYRLASAKEAVLDPDAILVEGITAYAAGEPREACPYPINSEARRLWLDGWDEAERVTAEEKWDERPPLG